MDKLRNLIEPDVYNIKQMEKMGWSDQTITSYCRYRKQKWNTACKIFVNMFSPLVMFVNKEYDYTKNIMEVIVYSKECKIICKASHDDPLFALAECAKILENEDVFITSMLQNLSI